MIEVAKLVNCHRSLLYHFESGNRTLGPALVTRMRKHIPACATIPDRAWLAAMGVDLS